MEFERAIKLLSSSDVAEVPVLASTEAGPQRFILKKTFREGGITTLHIQTHLPNLPCPLSAHITATQRRHFNNPKSAPATSTINDLCRTVRVFDRPHGRQLYFCHETWLDQAVRPHLRNTYNCIKSIRREGIKFYTL